MSTDPFRDEDLQDWQGLGYEIALDRRRLGRLQISSEHVVISDPVDAPFHDPLERTFPTGEFPVAVMSADLRDERSIAYLIIEFGEERAIRWEDLGTVEITSGMLSMQDADTASRAIDAQSADEEVYERILWRECSKNRRIKKLGWANIDTGLFWGSTTPTRHNMVCAEVPAGRYHSWVGTDSSGAVSLLVIDFGILDILFTPFGLRF